LCSRFTSIERQASTVLRLAPLGHERLNAYLEQYYGQPAAVMRSRQACYAGPNDGLVEWLQGYARAGTTHLVLRFAGDHERHLETVAALRSKLAC
jgi:hypothetical protein